MPIPPHRPNPHEPGHNKKSAGLQRPAYACLAGILLLAASVAAAQDRLQLGGEMGELPSLPGEARAAETDLFDVDTGSIGLSERSFDNVLGVRLDDYRELAPAVVVEKGWLVSRRLGIGGSYSMRSDSTELVLNGVFAPRRDVRLQISASQLRMSGFASSFGGVDETLVQTGVLSSVKKQWSKSRVQPEAGFAVYTARAAGSVRQHAGATGLELGTLAGYMLRLAAMPMTRARLEVSYQAQNTRYDNPLTPQWRDSQASTSVHYSQAFDQCSLLRGRFTMGPGFERTDLRYERGAFSVGYLQTRSDDYQDRMLQLSYSLALDAGRRPSPGCEQSPGEPTPFRALVDAATARPSYLPSEPLTRTVSAPDVPG